MRYSDAADRLVAASLLSLRANNPSSHNCSVCYDSRVLSSLFSLMARSPFKLQSIPFKQKLHFLIKARGRYQSGAVMHQALWCLTFRCDYTSACIPSWKSLDCCHLNMFFLASLTLLSYCKVTLTYKMKLVAFAISIFADEFLTLLAMWLWGWSVQIEIFQQLLAVLRLGFV